MQCVVNEAFQEKASQANIWHSPLQLEVGHGSVCMQKDVHAVGLHSSTVTLNSSLIFAFLEISISLTTIGTVTGHILLPLCGWSFTFFAMIWHQKANCWSLSFRFNNVKCQQIHLWSVIYKRCNDGKARSILPCLYEKRPPVVSAELQCGSADRDLVQAPPVAVRLRSRHLGPDVRESKTSRGQWAIQGKTTLEKTLKPARTSFTLTSLIFFTSHSASMFLGLSSRTIS